ncbi:MAG: response regulator [Ardenticatenales bacterium]|nr:response regulator [Ardenticatenales bacterium]
MASPAHVLIIEGRRKSHSFSPELRDKGFQITVAHTGRRAETILGSEQPDVVVMDATFYRSSGVRICTMVRTITPGIPLIYINAAGKSLPAAIRTDASLTHPFTIRKLINRLNRLLASRDGPTYRAGPLTLYLEKRAVLINRRERRLTPKQTQLLAVLMQRPGEVISRRELIRTVWDTEFMGDTRTLDVHIRWVREAVEDNPSKPRYITTVRGKGYRFSIPGS